MSEAGEMVLPPKQEIPPFDEKHYNKYILGALNTAFNVQSNGMGVMSQALEKLTTDTELTPKEEEALRDMNSNYFIQEYVKLWLKDPSQLTPNEKLLYPKLGPKNRTPLTDKHVAVYNQGLSEYKKITDTIIRQALHGNANIQVLYNSHSPLTGEEFTSLRASAAQRGIIHITNPNATFTTPPINIGIFMNGTEHGIHVPDNLATYIKDLPFFGIMKEKTKHAATLKLGAMLGLTDQITYDAKAVGRPLSKEYKPHDEHFTSDWQNELGKDMPDIDHLYQDAHRVFLQASISENSLTSYLRPMTTLPQLA